MDTHPREKYWRYSLMALLIGLGALIFWQSIPYLGGLLGAVTLYILMRRQMRVLLIVHRMRRSVAATLLLLEAVVCFLVPLSLIIWWLGMKLQSFSVDPAGIIESAKSFSQTILERTNYDLLSDKNIEAIVGMISKMAGWLVGGVFSFVVDVLVLLFVLYFMLVGGRRMERYLMEFIPFGRGARRDLVHELSRIVRSNAIGVPLLAVIQGVVAGLGYWVFGVTDPLFWGLVTCVASIIPVVGTALVWVPMGIYLWVVGPWGLGLGLLLYGVVVITQADNLPRLLLQKRLADTHPLVTIFGALIGLSLFGFMGVIFGPVLLALFLFCGDLFKQSYLDERPDLGDQFRPSSSSERMTVRLHRLFAKRSTKHV